MYFRNNLTPVCLAYALAVGLLSTPASAQDTVIDAAGTCPPPSSGGFQADFRAPEDAQLEVVQPNISVFQGADLAATVDGLQYSFGTSLEVIETADSGRVLLVRDRGITGKCGWIDARGVVSPKVLKVRDLPGYENATGITEEAANNLEAKIVARATESGAELRPIQLYSAPSPESQYKLKELNYFAVANVFRQSRADGRACDSIDREDCFLLLGGTDFVETDFGDVAVGDLIGWAKGSEVSLWPSTIAIYFADGATEVPTFDNLCAADSILSGRRCDPTLNTGPVAFGSAVPFGDAMFPRFPVVDVKPVGEGAFVYEIVAALEVCDSTGTACRDSTDILTWQGQIGAALRGLQTVDILFVMDASESMESYFGPTVQATADFAQSLSGTGISARFGAVVYNDYLTVEGTPDTLSYAIAANFGEVGDASSVRNLSRTSAIQSRVSDNHCDKPEAPYAAIVRALDDQQLSWNADAGLRMVVLIGDVGNRPEGREDNDNTGCGLPYVNETVTAETIRDTVNRVSASEGVAIVFSAVNVPGNAPADLREDFGDDFNAIETALGSQIPLQIAAGASPGETRQEVGKAFDVLRTTISQARRIIGGDDQAPASSEDLPAFQVAKRLVSEKFAQIDQPDRLEQGDTLSVDSYWVVQQDDTPQFGYWVGLNEPDLDTFSVRMVQLCSALERTDLGAELNAAYDAVLEVVTRERVPKDIVMSEYLSKKLSVPKKNFSAFLDSGTPLDIYNRIINDNTERAKLKAEVCRKSFMVSRALEGKRISPDDIEFVAGRAQAKPDKMTTFSWDWIAQGGVRTYFLPLSFLP